MKYKKIQKSKNIKGQIIKPHKKYNWSMVEFTIYHIHGQPRQQETHFNEVTHKCSSDTENGQFQEKKDSVVQIL